MNTTTFYNITVFIIIILIDCKVLDAEIIAIDGNNQSETFMDFPYLFDETVQGALVVSEPWNACSNISEPPSNETLNWFILIGGRACNFYTKMQYAALAKYSAALIENLDLAAVNFMDADYTNNYRHKAQYHKKIVADIPNNITVVAVSHSTVARLKEKYIYTVDPKSRIAIMPNGSFKLLSFLLLFGICACMFVLLMLLFMMVKCIQQARQRRHNRLSSRHLKQLPILKYKRGEHPYETCAICLDDFKDKERLRILPCSHGYHSKCIDPWLTNNQRTCPICKQKVSLHGVHSDTDSDSDTESRAETRPLLGRAGTSRSQHGTFTNVLNIPPFVGNTSSYQAGSGETTSRDVPSDTFDETSDDDLATRRIATSAPILSYFPSPPIVPCNSLNSAEEIASQETLDSVGVYINNEFISDGANADPGTSRGSKKSKVTKPLVV